MSETGAMQRRTSLCELLDRFVDAQRLDIKAYSSGHLNESRSYCPPHQTQPCSWTGQNRSSTISQTAQKPGMNVTSQNKAKKDGLTKPINDSQMKPHNKLRLSKPPNLSKMAKNVDSKHVTCSAVHNQVLSPFKPQGICRDAHSLKDHALIDELHLPVQVDSVQKNVNIVDANGNATSLPVTRTFSSNVVPSLKATGTTKKDQFRKMRDYYNNVIQYRSCVHQHALTGSDAVKHLEHRLQEV